MVLLDFHKRLYTAETMYPLILPAGEIVRPSRPLAAGGIIANSTIRVSRRPLTVLLLAFNTEIWLGEAA